MMTTHRERLRGGYISLTFFHWSSDTLEANPGELMHNTRKMMVGTASFRSRRQGPRFKSASCRVGPAFVN